MTTPEQRAREMLKERSPLLRFLFAFNGGLGWASIAELLCLPFWAATTVGVLGGLATWALIDVYWNWPDRRQTNPTPPHTGS